MDFFLLIFYSFLFLIIVYSQRVKKEEKNITGDQSEPEDYILNFVRFKITVNEESEKYYTYFYEYINQTFGKHLADKAIEKAKIYIEKNINPDINIKKRLENLNHKSRLRILFFLFDLAAADKRISIKELAYIESFRTILNVSDSVYAKVKIHYIKEVQQKEKFSSSNIKSENSMLHEAFSVLQISENADVSEIKNAYRKLAKIYHPDKFAQKSSYEIKTAEQTFMIITEAYEYIKSVKGIN